MRSKMIGRIVARGEVAGLFIPLGDKNMNGIYDIIEVMGEISIMRVGTPDIEPAKLTALSLEGLMDARPNSCMTAEEIKKIKGKTGWT